MPRPSNWVAGLGMVAYQQINEYRQGELLAPAGRFAYQSDPEREDVTVVFVIGETARADHMGLLGYARNTTPLLAQELQLRRHAGLVVRHRHQAVVALHVRARRRGGR